MGVQGLCDQGVAQDGLEGLHVRTALDIPMPTSCRAGAHTRFRQFAVFCLHPHGPRSRNSFGLSP